MNTMKTFAAATLTAAVLLSLGACAGMSTHDKNIATGAGIGAIGGAVLKIGRAHV